MRACWLKWVGWDWSISADYIWLIFSDANSSQMNRSLSRITEAKTEALASDIGDDQLVYRY